MSHITFLALRRGLCKRCPRCGEGRVLTGYLETVPACPVCAAPLGHLRADDMPPWLTILVTGHLLAPFIIAISRHTDWSTGQQLALWLPITLALIFMLLPRAKGVTLALLWGMEQPSPAKE